MDKESWKLYEAGPKVRLGSLRVGSRVLHGNGDRSTIVRKPSAAEKRRCKGRHTSQWVLVRKDGLDFNTQLFEHEVVVRLKAEKKPRKKPASPVVEIEAAPLSQSVDLKLVLWGNMKPQEHLFVSKGDEVVVLPISDQSFAALKKFGLPTDVVGVARLPACAVFPKVLKTMNHEDLVREFADAGQAFRFRKKG